MANEVGDTATGEPGADEPSPGDHGPADGAPPSTGRHRSDGGHHMVPPALRPGATGPRLDGIDAARGLAVLSMLVGPLGGLPTLAAPLFVLVVGTAMGVALDRPGVARGRLVMDNVLRGVLLVLLGLGLQALTPHADAVLPVLGVLVAVLAPLALLLRPAPVLALAVVVAGAVLGPLVTERARDAVASGTAAGGPLDDLLSWTASGPDHRLVSVLPVALAGVLLAPLLPRLAGPGAAAVVAVVLLAAGAVVHGIGTGTADGASLASGTTPAVVAAAFLAAGVVVVAVAVVLARDGLPRLRRVLGAVLVPVLALGRLALTAYTLEVLLLALVSAVGDGRADDDRLLLGVAAVVVVAVCWVLDRRLGTGPLEVLVRVARVPAHGRHGGALSGRRPPRGPGSPR